MNISPIRYTQSVGIILLILGLLGVAGSSGSVLEISFNHAVMLLAAAFVALASSRTSTSAARSASLLLGAVFAITGMAALVAGGASLVPSITLGTSAALMHVVIGITGILVWRTSAPAARETA